MTKSPIRIRQAALNQHPVQQLALGVGTFGHHIQIRQQATIPIAIGSVSIQFHTHASTHDFSPHKVRRLAAEMRVGLARCVRDLRAVDAPQAYTRHRSPAVGQLKVQRIAIGGVNHPCNAIMIILIARATANRLPRVIQRGQQHDDAQHARHAPSTTPTPSLDQIGYHGLCRGFAPGWPPLAA